MNTYLFIAECDIDVKKAKGLLKGKAKIRDTGKLLNPVFFEEFGEYCGHPIYEMKTDLDLKTIRDKLNCRMDLHYIYQTIQPEKDFTGERDYDI